MSASSRKAPSQSISPSRQALSPTTSSSSSPRRPSQTPSNAVINNSPVRTRSIRGAAGSPLSARSAANRPPRPGNSALGTSAHNEPYSLEDDDDRSGAAAAVIEDLKAQLQIADLGTETAQRQLSICQTRLDEALGEQSKLEERAHEQEREMEGSQTERMDWLRVRRELERMQVTEREERDRERKGWEARERESRVVNERLKEKLAAQRGAGAQDDDKRISRTNTPSTSLDNGHFAPPSADSLDAPPPPVPRKNSDNPSQAQVIESLRLDLAASQIKLIESENVNSAHYQELERLLLETRMANARLQEDNESFQLLLSEKTLNGDFVSKAGLMRRSISPTAIDEEAEDQTGSGFSGSLADELESASSPTSTGYNDKTRRLEAEVKAVKDQNKALTLYISNIIERLLSHKDFEAILDKTPNLLAGPSAASTRAEKALPPPPPVLEASGEQILQRARSVATASGTRPRPGRERPQSYMPPAPSAITDDPSTAPRVAPLGRSQSVRNSHRRANSELAHPPTTTATVVGQMYRANTGTTSPPTAAGMQHSRQPASFAPPTAYTNPSAAARIPSSGTQRSTGGGGGDTDGDVLSTRTGSPPLAPTVAPTSAPVMGGGKLRPLRLVQENKDESSEAAAEQERKSSVSAKRGSWMGWFNKGKDEGGPGGVLGREVVKE